MEKEESHPTSHQREGPPQEASRDERGIQRSQEEKRNELERTSQSRVPDISERILSKLKTMTTLDKPIAILPPQRTKNEALLAFLVTYMDYAEEDANNLMASEFDQIKDLAVRTKNSLLGDKGLSVGFRAKVKEYDIE